MNTRMDIILPKNNGSEERIFSEIETTVRQVERKLSRFDKDSEVYHINNIAHIEPVSVSPEVFNLVKLAKQYHENTDGLFDISLSKLYHLLRYKRIYPKKINALKKELGMDKVRLDTSKNTIFFDTSEVSLDFGAIGKGYALQQLIKLKKVQDVDYAFINLGDSTIWAKGHHPAGDYWPVGIRDMLNMQTNIHEFKVKDSTVSISGTISGGTTGRPHILDIKSGMFVNDKWLCAVLSADPVEAEILSTSFLLLEYHKKEPTFNNQKFDEAIIAKYSDNSLIEKFEISNGRNE